MILTMKRQMRVVWRDWIWSFLLIFGVELFGAVLFYIIYRTDGEITGYFALGTMMAAIIAAIYAGLMIMLQVSICFNLEVSMGCTRKHFFVSYYLVSFVELLLNWGLMILLNVIDRRLSRWMYPELTEEVNYFPYLLKWELPVTAGIVTLGVFCGAVLMRFGKKAFWVLWCLWMILCIGGPRVWNAVEDAPGSVFGRIGTGIGMIVKAVPTDTWIGSILCISLLGAVAAYLLLKRQQVNM